MTHAPVDEPHVSVAAFDPVDDGSALTTGALQAAIDACAERGGGRVVVPPGEYRVGTVVLADGVDLHVEAGATIRGSEDLGEYVADDLTAFGEPIPEPAPLLLAVGADDVALTGRGRVDGSGRAFWTRGDDRYEPAARPGRMIQFVRCRNVRIADVAVENSPAWTVHLVDCEDVFVRGVTITNDVYGPNTDGIDPDGCRDVVITECDVTTGDDAVVPKNVYKGFEAMPTEPSRDILVSNCTLTSATNGFKIGTENVADFSDVAVSNCVLRSPLPGVDYAVDDGFGPKTAAQTGVALEMVDGATMRRVAVSNVVVRDAQVPLFVRLGNRRRWFREGDPDAEPGRIRDVGVSNLVATGASRPCMITGIPERSVGGVSVDGLRVVSRGGETDPAVLERAVPEHAGDYPAPWTWSDPLPASGLYARHVEGLSLGNVRFAREAADVRPAVVCDDLRDFDLSGVRTDAPAGDAAALRFEDVRNALVRGAVAPTGAAAALDVVGEETGRITVAASDLAAADEAARTGDGVPDDALELLAVRLPD